MNEIFVVEGMTCSSCAMTVEKALKEGANVNVVNGEKRTGLMRASKRGHLEVVQHIIEHGADVTLRDIFGKDLASNGDFTLEKRCGCGVNVMPEPNPYGNPGMLKIQYN